MKNSCIGFKNRLVLYKILTDPAYQFLAASFYDTFLGFALTDTRVDTYPNMTFITKGAFCNALEIIGRDDLGVKHLIHIRFIEMHLGLTSGYFDMSEYKWRDLKQHIRGENFRYSYCQTIREMCFFNFNFSSHSDFYSIRKYDFEKLPTTIQFDSYELEKCKIDMPNEEISACDLWLYFFKNSGTSTEEISKMPLFPLLKAVFDTNNWDKEEKKQYQEHRKYHKERCAEMTQRYIESGVELDKKYLNKPALEVEWNWLLLEKQLGQLPKNKVKASDIDLSALKADLPQLAFDLFRKWTKKCLEKHPSLDLTIIDEQILVKDVQQQMQESLIALFNNDTFYRRNRSKDYATGFVIGYVQGSLSSHWYMEYVIKTNDIFKTTMALQSLSTYLQTEDVMRLQVDRIYEEVMRGKVNLSNPKLDIQKIDLTSKKGKVIEKNNSKGVVQTALINLVNEYINKISAIEIEDFDLTVSDFIDSQKIERFIETNWHLF